MTVVVNDPLRRRPRKADGTLNATRIAYGWDKRATVRSNYVRRLALFASVLLGACGSSGQSGDGGGAPPSASSVASLSDGQRGSLCDQLAATEGGYSHSKTLTCDGGTETVSFQIGADQSQCKQILQAVGSSCGGLTVGEVQACVTDTYAQTCAGTASLASCDPFFTCLLGDASAH